MLDLVDQLSYAGNEAARRYLDGQIDAAAAADWLEKYAMMPRARAEQRVKFFDQYRSYVINYNLGKDLVRAFIERRTKGDRSPRRRWTEFAALLSSPRLPSGLKTEVLEIMRAVEITAVRSARRAADRRAADSRCPGPGEVLIKVVAAGVNRPDVIQRIRQVPAAAGRVRHSRASKWPATSPGAAPDVVQWRDGDAVCALVSGGGYAEYCVAPQVQCLPPPDACRWWTRRRFPRRSSPCGPTSSSAAALRAGETHARARRIERHRHDGDSARPGAWRAGVRDRRQRREVRRLPGARRRGRRELPDDRLGAGVSGRDGRPRRRARPRHGRAATTWRAISSCSPSKAGSCRSRFSSRRESKLDLMQVMRRRLTITGSTLRPRSPEEKGAIARQLDDHVWPLFAARRRPSGHPRRLPARSSRRRAPHDGRGPPHRQDSADGVASHLCPHLSAPGLFSRRASS